MSQRGGWWNKKEKKLWAKIASTWGRLMEEEEKKMVGKNSLHLGEAAGRRRKNSGKNDLHLGEVAAWKKKKKLWANMASTWGRLLEEEERKKLWEKIAYTWGEVAGRRLKNCGKK
jgi:hypothetical protein